MSITLSALGCGGMAQESMLVLYDWNEDGTLVATASIPWMTFVGLIASKVGEAIWPFVVLATASIALSAFCFSAVPEPERMNFLSVDFYAKRNALLTVLNHSYRFDKSQ